MSDADLGSIPDVRLDTERLVWQSIYRAGILIQLPPTEPEFAEAIAREVDRGLRGRGSSLMGKNNRLFVDFGVTASEAEEGSLLAAYREQLLHHLGLKSDALIIEEIEEYEFDAEDIAEFDRIQRAFGLRAIAPRSAPQEFV